MLPIASVRMVANQKLSRKDFVSARTELGRSKECCCFPLRLPKSYFRHNRHFATSTIPGERKTWDVSFLLITQAVHPKGRLGEAGA